MLVVLVNFLQNIKSKFIIFNKKLEKIAAKCDTDIKHRRLIKVWSVSLEI